MRSLATVLALLVLAGPAGAQERADSAAPGNTAARGRLDGRAAARRSTGLLRMYGDGVILGGIVGVLTPRDFNASETAAADAALAATTAFAALATAANEADRRFADADSVGMVGHADVYRYAYEDAYRREYMARRRWHGVLATLVGALAAYTAAGLKR